MIATAGFDHDGRPRAVGVDGCRGGWVCATRSDSGTPEAIVIGTFAAILTRWPDAVIAIDMPIGLPNEGGRTCDRLARLRLGPRRASVFPAPPRPVLCARTNAAASALRRAIDGQGVSAQTFGIIAKIREVDRGMSPALQDRVIETHPELAFAAMNGGSPPASGKKAPEGRSQRLALLEPHFPGVVAVATAWHDRRSGVDDLLDALAALWTSERLLAGDAVRLPEHPDHDGRGLRMEICY